MLDDNEHEKAAKEDVVDLDETARPDVWRVVLPKNRPTQARRRWNPRFGQVLLDCVLAAVDAELEQFAPNPLCTPGQILGCHLVDHGKSDQMQD